MNKKKGKKNNRSRRRSLTKDRKYLGRILDQMERKKKKSNDRRVNGRSLSRREIGRGPR